MPALLLLLAAAVSAGSARAPVRARTSGTIAPVPQLRLGSPASAASPRAVLPATLALPPAAAATAARGRPEVPALPAAALAAEPPERPASAAAARQDAQAAPGRAPAEAPTARAQLEGASRSAERGAELGLKFDGGLARPDAAPVPAQPAPGLVGRVKWLLSPPVIPLRFKLENPRSYYHGTSFDALERIVEAGGRMRTPSFFSEDGGFSYSYAKSKARGSKTPGVVLEFVREDLAPGLVVDRLAIEPGPGESTRGIPMFMKSTREIDLSRMTEASKDSLLAWARAQRDAHPGDAAWERRVRKLEAALRPAR